MTLAQELGRFVAGLDLAAVPATVVQKARTCLLNGYGIALGGHATPFAPVARRAVLRWTASAAQAPHCLATAARPRWTARCSPTRRCSTAAPRRTPVALVTSAPS